MVSVPLRRGPPLAAKGRNSMKSSDLIFAIALVGLIGGTAQATPLGLSRSLGSPSLSVLPIHGCHHTYAHDLQGWHRHGMQRNAALSAVSNAIGTRSRFSKPLERLLRMSVRAAL